MKARFDIISRIAVVAITAAAVSLCACKRVPSGIIGPDDMSEILADVHTAEAVSSMETRQYDSDSARLALKMAVFERHGVTSEEFDSSLVWYAHNIDKYIDVYDHTIELLRDRSQNVGTMLVQAAISMAGDSVDVWPASNHLVLTRRLPSMRVGFDLPYDENWERGDMYSFKTKVADGEGTAFDWIYVANYEDKTVEFYQTSATTGVNGWNESTFVTDSTKNLVRLRGYFAPQHPDRAIYWLDSISLLRKRVDPAKYQLRYQVRSHHGL